MKFTVDWYGDEVIAETQRTMRDAVERVSRDVEADAAARCPVETGRLKGSISTSSFSGDGVEIGFVSVGGGDAYYASFVELGTARISANPFLRTAIRANKRKAAATITAALKKVLAK